MFLKDFLFSPNWPSLKTLIFTGCADGDHIIKALAGLREENKTFLKQLEKFEINGSSI